MKKIIKALGCILIFVVIALYIPITVPKFLGYGEYTIISGSMEPTIPVGALVYVTSADTTEVYEGDIITFDSNGSVVTHRVAAINDDGSFTTKGDANDSADLASVYPTAFIGKVSAYVPLLGYVATFLSSSAGRVIMALVLVAGIVILQIAGLLDKKNGENNRDEETRGKKKSLGPKLLLVAGLVIIVVASCGIYSILSNYSASNKLYDELEEEYVTTAPEASQWYELVDVDFEDLWQVNEDVVAWIYVENTDISYPIALGVDDNQYLRTSLDGTASTAGTIFLEAENSGDFSDSHSIIYGHNMRNLSMFGTLKFYKTEEGYLEDGHQYFQIITPERKMRFQIFSYFDTDGGSWVYAVPYSDSENFTEYIGQLLKSSYQSIEADKDITSADKIVTLSTCSSNDRRFTIHGVLVDER